VPNSEAKQISFPLIKLAKKLKGIFVAVWNLLELEKFPLIKLAKKLKASS
jgi:hypothetical protein